MKTQFCLQQIDFAKLNFDKIYLLVTKKFLFIFIFRTYSYTKYKVFKPRQDQINVHQDTAVTFSSRNGQNESQTTEFNSYQFAINSIKIINSHYVPLLLDILPRYSSNFFPLVWLVNCGNSFHFDSRIVKASRHFKNCVLHLHDAFAYLFLTNFVILAAFV